MAQHEQFERADRALIELLVSRDGQRTLVVLRDGQRLSVVNVAWAYDEGDAYAHVTTNVSPSLEGEAVDFCFTKEVVVVQDDSGRPLITAE